MKFIKFFNEGVDNDTISYLSEKFNISKIAMEIIFAKGYQTEEQIAEFISPLQQPFVNPFLLDNMQQCVEKIKKAVATNKRILVFGDYDVDGISATAVMLKTLKKMGVSADCYLPNRYVDGYGLTIDVIDKIKTKYNPELIITVDCGISCHKEVEYCFKNNIDIIVTDHHEIPEIVPNTIIVNPKLKNQSYDFDGLCGTGVAFKIAQALLGEEETLDLLPIVAIATIADIVPLVKENRVIVSRGLKLMNEYLPIGLKTMFKDNKISLTSLDASDIAFKIAPRLNASGRMGDAKDSLDLIMATDPVEIKHLIEKINGHNTKRQELCNKVYKDCKTMLKNYDMSKTPAIILASPDWDHGILGIACSRLVEKYNRPVFLFSINGDELKGSARSIPDINIHHVLSSTSDILEVFGGHKIAAGLTLKQNHFQEFCDRVYSFIYEHINDKAFIPIEYYDMEINVEDINKKLLDDLKLIEPCGTDNSKPKFMISSSKCQIVPLKNSPAHANIIIGKKLNLIFFHYLKEQAKLNFAKEYKFIFELQNQSKSVFKGVLKDFASSDELNGRATKFLDAFKINQLCYQTNKQTPNYSICNESQILELLLDCKSTVFGTCFVCFNFRTYNNFIQNYDLSNIYSINLLEGEQTGFNSVVFAPNSLNFMKNYKNIVFLDQIYDSSYISEINKITNANIYVLKSKENMEIFKNINIDRKYLSAVYFNIINFEGQNFTSILSIYNAVEKICKIHLDFINFLFCFRVFEELNIIISHNEDDFISFTINKNIKTELEKSSLYNTVKLLSKII